MAKLLLVEDDKSLREIYGVRLLAEGYDIVSAGDGEEALAMAIKEKPQLIISDVMMPKISGFDMLDILRSTTETRDIKVIMMTALSSEDQRARGEQLGADKYLVKSQVGIEDVVRTVHEVLGDSTNTAAAPATETPTPASTSAPTTPTTSDSSAPASDDTTAPAADSTAPEPTADTTTVASGAAPGNDEAGPLPPQPTELKPEEPQIDTPEPVVPESAPAESTLPQPTAPFSSPRPATLGEDIVHPESDTAVPAAPETPEATAEVTPEESQQLHNELQATSEPISTQVDSPVEDGDTSPSIQPPVGESLPPNSGMDFEATPAPAPTETPADEENKNDTQGPVSTSSPIS